MFCNIFQCSKTLRRGLHSTTNYGYAFRTWEIISTNSTSFEFYTTIIRVSWEFVSITKWMSQIFSFYATINLLLCIVNFYASQTVHVVFIMNAFKRLHYLFHYANTVNMTNVIYNYIYNETTYRSIHILRIYMWGTF